MMRRIFFIIFSLLLFINCSDKYKDSKIYRFPVAIGNSWVYERIFYVIVYDTVNNDTSEYMSYDTIGKEFQDMDTMAGWECYKLYKKYTPQFIWYAHPDSALLEIAYTSTGTKKGFSSFFKKIKFKFRDSIFNSVQELSDYIHSIKNGISFKRQDTFYWEPPKKLFVYPLRTGISWIAMTDPWIEERKVTGKEIIEVPADRFNALKIDIHSEWMRENELWYEWVSEKGIIKDTMYFTGEATDENGKIIGYFFGEDVYRLIDYNLSPFFNN